jgi:hypothetical protein
MTHDGRSGLTPGVQGYRSCPDYAVGLSFRVNRAGNLLRKMPERGILCSKSCTLM